MVRNQIEKNIYKALSIGENKRGQNSFACYRGEIEYGLDIS